MDNDTLYQEATLANVQPKCGQLPGWNLNFGDDCSYKTCAFLRILLLATS